MVGSAYPTVLTRIIGDMPYHRTVKNMELFATEVMPVLREEFKDMQKQWAAAA